MIKVEAFALGSAHSLVSRGIDRVLLCPSPLWPLRSMRGLGTLDYHCLLVRASGPLLRIRSPMSLRIHLFHSLHLKETHDWVLKRTRNRRGSAGSIIRETSKIIHGPPAGTFTLRKIECSKQASYDVPGDFAVPGN
jgi:hypothetical protein